MNKSEFLASLEPLLAQLPLHVQKEILAYYDELLNKEIEAGKAEEEVIASIDSPKSVANYHIAQYMLDTAESDLTTPNIFRAMGAILKLGFSNLSLLIGPILGIAGALFALLTASLTVIITGCALLIGVFIGPYKFSHFSVPIILYENSNTSAGTFFLSLGLIAFGLLFFIGLYLLIRLLYLGTIKHLRFHLKLPRKPDLMIRLPRINFKKPVMWLTISIFICFSLAVLLYLLGGNNWFVSV